MDVIPLSVPPEEAQFLESRKFQVTEIARAFGVPPHLIGDMERATFSNIEHQYMEFLQFSLGPYLKQIEQVIHARCMTAEERKVYFVEHLRDSMLQADTMTRFQAHALGRQWGWLSVNDIRTLENMNPVDGGDEYLVPLNMTPAGTLQQLDARAQGEAQRRKEKQLQELPKVTAEAIRSKPDAAMAEGGGSNGKAVL
jgi:phage portal protein BeeE